MANLSVKYMVIILFVSYTLGSVTYVIAAPLPLRIQTSEKINGELLNFLNENWVARVPEFTDGSLSLELYPVDTLVPQRETSRFVSMGILDGDLTLVSLFSRKHRQFIEISENIAKLSSPKEILKYCFEAKGGRDLLQELHDEINDGVDVLGCGAFSPELLANLEAKRVLAEHSNSESIDQPKISAKFNENIIGAAWAAETKNSNVELNIGNNVLKHELDLTNIYQFTVSNKIWGELPDHVNPSVVRRGLEKWFQLAFADLYDDESEVDENLPDSEGKSDEIIPQNRGVNEINSNIVSFQ